MPVFVIDYSPNLAFIKRKMKLLYFFFNSGHLQLEFAMFEINLSI